MIRRELEHKTFEKNYEKYEVFNEETKKEFDKLNDEDLGIYRQKAEWAREYFAGNQEGSNNANPFVPSSQEMLQPVPSQSSNPMSSQNT